MPRRPTGLRYRRSTRRFMRHSGSSRSTTIYQPTQQAKVILEVQPKYQIGPTALSRIYVPSTNGVQVPLSAVAHFVNQVEPLTVNHQGVFPAVTLSFNLAPGVALEPGGRRHFRAQGAASCACLAAWLLPGHRAGLPGVADFDTALAAGRHHRDLRRPRDALRELHSSDHHPVVAAVGRRRRAADADVVPLRADA